MHVSVINAKIALIRVAMVLVVIEAGFNGNRRTSAFELGVLRILAIDSNRCPVSRFAPIQK